MPVSAAWLRSSSSASVTISLKSAVATDWNAMPATLRCFSPSAVSSVTWAVVMANSRSLVGTFSLRLPPRRASRKPTRQAAVSPRWSSAS